MPVIVPATSAKKVSSLRVTVQSAPSAAQAAFVTFDCRQSTSHVLSPPLPPVSTKASEPPTW